MYREEDYVIVTITTPGVWYGIKCPAENVKLHKSIYYKLQLAGINVYLIKKCEKPATNAVSTPQVKSKPIVLETINTDPVIKPAVKEEVIKVAEVVKPVEKIEVVETISIVEDVKEPETSTTTDELNVATTTIEPEIINNDSALDSEIDSELETLDVNDFLIKPDDELYTKSKKSELESQTSFYSEEDLEVMTKEQLKEVLIFRGHIGRDPMGAKQTDKREVLVSKVRQTQ